MTQTPDYGQLEQSLARLARLHPPIVPEYVGMQVGVLLNGEDIAYSDTDVSFAKEDGDLCRGTIIAMTTDRVIRVEINGGSRSLNSPGAGFLTGQQKAERHVTVSTWPRSQLCEILTAGADWVWHSESFPVGGALVLRYRNEAQVRLPLDRTTGQDGVAEVVALLPSLLADLSVR